MWQSYLLLIICCYGFCVDAIRPSPPLISNQPEVRDIIFKLDKPFIINCHAKGEPVPTYRWTKNGVPFDWHDHHDRMTMPPWSGTLVVTEPHENDIGQYQCFATNAFGIATSNSVFVRADQPELKSDVPVIMNNSLPFFTKEPEVITDAVFETATLFCEAHGIPEPNISWIYNGRPITEAISNERRTISTNSITITNMLTTDTGNYGCNASNIHGYVYRDVYLNILPGAIPEIIKHSGSIVTVTRHNVTLECNAFGPPKPDIQWTKDGNELNAGRFKVANNGNLEIINVTSGDAGQYKCDAVNKYGNVSATSELIVKNATYFVQRPQDDEVYKNQSVIFNCTATADADLVLNIDWLMDGVIINQSDSRFSKFVTTSNLNTKTYNLQISSAVPLDAGKYSCVAYTEFDTVDATANLYVLSAPNAPKVTKVDCYDKLAIISWETQGQNQNPITQFIIQFSTSFTPDTWEQAEVRPSTQSTQYTAAIEMSPWTNYTFRVFADNEIGQSLPSANSQTCTTPADVPYKHPEYVEAKGTEPNSLTIRWRPMPEVEHNGPKFQYRVFWKRDLPTTEWLHRDVINWTQLSVKIPNALIYQLYRVKVIALNQYGEAKVAAQEVTGYSGEGIPTDPPVNFTVNQIFKEEVLLGWIKVSNESVRGHLKGYKIEIWTNDDAEQKREIKIKKDTGSYRLKGLIPGTNYFAHIMVFNGQHNGPASNILSFTTLEDRPGSVHGIKALPLGSTAFWISWTPPLRPNGQIIGYKIYYQEIGDTQVTAKRERNPQISVPDTLSAKLTGLKPNTMYRLYVVAVTKVGDGYEHHIDAKTHERSPMKPDIPNFDIQTVGSKQNGFVDVKILWRPTGLRSGSEFFVKYRKDSEQDWQATGHELNEDYLILHSLEYGAKYEIRVVAVDENLITESESLTFGLKS